METTSKGLGRKIDFVRIRGFRSLADVELSGLSNATVLIGANGSGKSNFIRFFDMLSWMLRRQFGEFVERCGGADDQLYGGNTTTGRIQGEVTVGSDLFDDLFVYQFALSYAQPDRLIFTEEAIGVGSEDSRPTPPFQHLGSGGHREAEIVEAAQAADWETKLQDIQAEEPFDEIDRQFAQIVQRYASLVVRMLRDCSVYQFHNTSDSSNFKKRWDAEDNNTLHTHGGNLAAVLHRLEHEDIKRFEMICRQISRILPVFDRFQIEESHGKVSLRWKAKGMDKSFGAHLTSDGSLRFFALVTLLNLPPEMLPGILLLDEPELGLHPAAVALVGGMIRALAEERQIIVATQSPLLVDAFDLDEIVVVELQDGRTQFKRLDPDAYRVWLDDNFTTGELWQKNLLGGRP